MVPYVNDKVLRRSVFKEVEKLLLEKGYSKEQVKKILRAISTLKLKGMVCYYITEMLKFKPELTTLEACHRLAPIEGQKESKGGVEKLRLVCCSWCF
jgi:hypothetical protein